MINPQDRISVDPKAALSTCLAASASCARAGSLISKAVIQSCELETSVGAHSSVDRQGCTDDVGCLVRANEHDGIGNFFGSADPLVRKAIQTIGDGLSISNVAEMTQLRGPGKAS